MQTEAKELYAFITSNTEQMRKVECSFRAMEKHWRAGRYDDAKAFKLVQRNVRNAASAYCKSYCLPPSRWTEIFPLAVRNTCCLMLLIHFSEELDAGNSWLGEQVQCKS